jgi:hypothetical protein
MTTGYLEILLVQKLIVIQLVKKYSYLRGTQIFITAFRRASPCSLFRAAQVLQIISDVFGSKFCLRQTFYMPANLVLLDLLTLTKSIYSSYSMTGRIRAGDRHNTSLICLFLCVWWCQPLFTPNPLVGRPPIVGCPLLLMRIRNYRTYLEVVFLI